MLIKKIPCTLLFSLTSLTAHAYLIGTNFHIENNTPITMVIEIKQPNGQGDNIYELISHKNNQIYLSNGDNSGLLYQTSNATFTIHENDINGKIVAQGRIVYHVGAGMWLKYSFLDAITAADGLNVNATYSCLSGGYAGILNNKITLDGMPGDEMQATTFPAKATCKGFKSSILRENNQFYTPICVDGTNTVFWKSNPVKCDDTYCNTTYSNDINDFRILYTDDTMALQNELDREIGNDICGKLNVYV